MWHSSTKTFQKFSFISDLKYDIWICEPSRGHRMLWCTKWPIVCRSMQKRGPKGP